MAGYHVMGNGRYKCDFCDHTSYKTMSGITDHLNNNHASEMKMVLEEQVAELQGKLRKAENKPPVVRTIEKEKVVYKDKPNPKYWYHAVFCTACKEVMRNAGIPWGQTIEQTPHNGCGTRSLLPIERGV